MIPGIHGGAFDRRAFLKAGSIAAFRWITLGGTLAAQTAEPKAKSVIHLFLTGGLSQMDSFDPKLNAQPGNRTRFGAIPTSVPGFHISDRLPRLAKLAHKYTTIRSMRHNTPVHVPACGLILSGHLPLSSITHPCAGSVVSRELGPRNEMPAFCSVPGSTGYWEGAGYLEPRYNPFDTGNPNAEKFQVRDLELPLGVDWARMDRRRSLLHLADEKFRRYDSTGIIDNMNAYYQTAFGLMQSPRAKKAFDIAQEPEKLRQSYGRNSTGQGLLLARRLVEAGVRYVTVSRGFNTWDHHANIYPLLNDTFLPELDDGLAALIEDLDARGLLDETLVIATGEFGRTPEVNANGGRDHWANAFSLVLAGAGIPGGAVIGETDSEGGFVTKDPVDVPDLLATIYEKVGVDYRKEYVNPLGRPTRLAADGHRPIRFS
ncbi:MAG: DUF1501 domain-containing protein [Acidobacteria bacterium]|nr:DUF1501 domain-containing protein [Acidobacteriota bacterium]